MTWRRCDPPRSSACSVRRTTSRVLRAPHASDVSGVLLQHVGSYDPPTDLIEAVGSSVLPAL
ncbi:hypothetical protein [Streptomyces lavenduligriseus]|uniref:Uncharacterized protein n=1 Tax=Streptomyces lavenduligriseus TaxID=67315 RepID=A0ABT0P5K9_9ACTN|nr:hypothetical protein [Streptomyces lavenduligriseus]MCL3999009.1 hypothetical protein [Streptomyces lavenduligriseus]